MERHEVESSVIRAVGHTRVLEVEFESGRVYQYYDVPEAIFDAFLHSDSKGRYFNAHIRGKYPYRALHLAPPRDAAPSPPDGWQEEGTRGGFMRLKRGWCASKAATSTRRGACDSPA